MSQISLCPENKQKLKIIKPILKPLKPLQLPKIVTPIQTVPLATSTIVSTTIVAPRTATISTPSTISTTSTIVVPATTSTLSTIVAPSPISTKPIVSSIIATKRPLEISTITQNFLPKPVEYYSWKPEGIYTDYIGKIWYLPNHVGYSNWINREFIGIFDKKTYIEEIAPDRPPLFNYQQFIKSYFTPNSPYRGILLNHHMGSGKSRTAIVTAENFRLAGYKMIFMLPASLRDNAIAEIRLWGYSDISYPPKFSDKSDAEQSRIIIELNAKIRKVYHFISYNSSRILQDLSKIELNNACIIIDEVHDLINTIANESGKTGKMIYETFMRSRNCRFIAMSGTPPPINYPFELGLLFNILRGPMPKYSGNQTDTVNIEKIYGIDRFTAYPEDKMQFDDLYVDYKTKQLKNEVFFRRRAIGLTSFFHGADMSLYPTIIRLPIFKLQMDCVQFDGYLRARTDEIIRESKKSGRLLGPNTFRPNSRQFCNFGMPLEINRPISLSKFKQITFNNPFLNSFESFWTDKQINELNDLFCSLAEIQNFDNKDNKKIIDADQLYKIFKSRWASFKDQRARLQYFVGLINEADRIGLYNHIISRNEEIAILEPKQNQNGVEIALSELSGKYKNYLLEDLGKSSQKHLKMHENIESGPGHEGPIFVYSSFRTMEGIEIFSRELDLRGYRKFDLYKDSMVETSINKIYAILSGTESTELRTQILNFFNHPRNIYGKYLKILLGTTASAQGLSLLNCRQVHIMEPWWTPVLIMGRLSVVYVAFDPIMLYQRINVMFMFLDEYLSVLSNDQNLRLNEEFSTDEYLYHKANEKDELNQQFYKLLKEIAIDFVISARENRPLENGLNQVNPRTVSTNNQSNYNFLPNMYDEILELRDDANMNTTIGVAENKRYIVQKKFIVISVKSNSNLEQFIYFIDDNKKPECTKKLFKGEKLPIKVIELYDYKAMKYSQSCVLRAYVDEKGIKREIVDLTTQDL